MAEKQLNEISPDLRRMHSKAVDAAQRENTDYAIALFCQILTTEPGLLQCRKELRAAQFLKAGAASTGFFKKMMSSAGSSPQLAKAKMTLGKNPAEAMVIAEQILCGDPTNNAAHRIIADAAEALDLPLTHIFELETMAKNSPKDKALIMEFANAVAQSGSPVGVAEKILDELIRSSPYDTDLLQVQKNLSANKTMNEGGYGQIEGGEASYRDLLRNKDEAVSLEQEKRVQKSEDVTERLIGEYEARLPAEPDNLKMIRTLAELYTQKNRFDAALEMYARIKNSEQGGDSSLDLAIANTIVRKFDHAIAALNPFAPDHAEQLAKYQAEKLAFQLGECQKRAEKYPTDLAIRFELGVLYFQTGQIAEATKEFQKAQNNANKKIAAMSYLAQCFAKRKMFDLAADKLQDAIKEKAVFDEEKKDLIYNLGCVLENMGKKQEAFEQFKIIFKDDGDYKDVTAKVEAYYAGQ